VVWPVFVEVLYALLKHGRGVALIDDQEAVAEFAAFAAGADEAFGDRVGRGVAPVS
jgi:hypothetical protein